MRMSVIGTLLYVRGKKREERERMDSEGMARDPYLRDNLQRLCMRSIRIEKEKVRVKMSGYSPALSPILYIQKGHV